MHLIDCTPQEGRNPKEDFESINRELGLFNPELSRKPQLVACNKVDVPEARTNFELYQEFFLSQGLTPYPISAATGEGVEALLNAIAQCLAAMKN